MGQREISKGVFENFKSTYENLKISSDKQKVREFSSFKILKIKGQKNFQTI